MLGGRHQQRPVQRLTTSTPLLDHLRALHARGATVQESSVAEHGTGLGRLLQVDLDIKVWEEALSDRPEVEQLTAGRRELAMAIYAASSGLYVHAYAGLRIFLELSFTSVYFSANELHRRKWVADRQDFSWSRALDEDEGVLSAGFVSEFSETASADASRYAANASASYRHCSQFIHGKLAVTKGLPEQLLFDSSVLADWLLHAGCAATAVLYLLYARYGDELTLSAESHLGTTLESNFSHLQNIRDRLELANDGVSKNDC